MNPVAAFAGIFLAMTVAGAGFAQTAANSPHMPPPNPIPAQAAPAQMQAPPDIQIATPPDPHLAKALDYLGVAGIKKMAVSRGRFVLLPITELAHRSTKETDPAFWSDFQLAAWKQVEPRLPELILSVAKIYADMFSDGELDAMIAFEKSPAGQKLQAMRPQIASAEVRLTRGWGDSIAPGVVRRTLADLEQRKRPPQKP